MSTVRDLKVDTTTGDLVLDGADLALVADGESIAQAVRANLRLFLGEWFADLSVGVPWFQSILVKNPNLVTVRAAIRKAIQDTPGIAEIVSFSMTFDAGTRVLSVSFSATSDTGELVTFADSFTPTPEVT